MSDLYAELPLAADLDAGDWTKVVGSYERTHLGTTDARHALTTHVSIIARLQDHASASVCTAHLFLKN